MIVTSAGCKYVALVTVTSIKHRRLGVKHPRKSPVSYALREIFCTTAARFRPPLTG